MILTPCTLSPHFTTGYHITFPPSSSLHGFLLYLFSTRYSCILLMSRPVCWSIVPCRDNCSNIRESELFALFAMIFSRHGGIAATTLLIVSIVRHLIWPPLLILAIIERVCVCGSINHTFRFARQRGAVVKSVKRSRIGP